jgi:hypothetical protein
VAGPRWISMRAGAPLPLTFPGPRRPGGCRHADGQITARLPADWGGSLGRQTPPSHCTPNGCSVGLGAACRAAGTPARHSPKLAVVSPMSEARSCERSVGLVQRHDHGEAGRRARGSRGHRRRKTLPSMAARAVEGDGRRHSGHAAGVERFGLNYQPGTGVLLGQAQPNRLSRLASWRIAGDDGLTVRYRDHKRPRSVRTGIGAAPLSGTCCTREGRATQPLAVSHCASA